MNHKTNPLWKIGATAEEKRQIVQLDMRLRKLRALAHKISSVRDFIANRATVRARYISAEKRDGDWRRG